MNEKNGLETYSQEIKDIYEYARKNGKFTQMGNSDIWHCEIDGLHIYYTDLKKDKCERFEMSFAELYDEEGNYKGFWRKAIIDLVQNKDSGKGFYSLKFHANRQI